MSGIQGFVTKGFGVIIGLMLLIGFLFHMELIAFNNFISDKEKRYEQVMLAKEISHINTSITLEAMDSIIDRGELKIHDDRKEAIDTLFKRFHTLKEDFLASADTPMERSESQKVVKALTELEPVIKVTLTNLITSGASEDKFATIDDSIDDASDVINSGIEKIIKSIDGELKEADESLSGFQTNSLIILILIIAISVIISLVIARAFISRVVNSIKSLQVGLNSFFDFLNKRVSNVEDVKIDNNDEFGDMAKVLNENIKSIERSISQDEQLIKEATNVANSVKSGNLDIKIDANTTNKSLNDFKSVINDMLSVLKSSVGSDINKIKSTLNNFSQNDFKSNIPNANGSIEVEINHLHKMIVDMLSKRLDVGLNLESNATTLKDSSNKLSTSSTQQVASLEETSASIDNITQGIQLNNKKIEEMSKNANDTKTSATSGKKLAEKTASSMNDISESTNKILESIESIDQIAFQTNILSLNAAVEAATAGESGKGFAVVAGEVRNLASRSAEAARDIKDIVDSADNKAKEGRVISDEMEKGYEVLLDKIGNTASLITEIENSANEQLRNIEQINNTMGEIDRSTQENAIVAQNNSEIANKTYNMAKDIVADVKSVNF
jgi:methyl-accepting chemotaxis protein